VHKLLSLLRGGLPGGSKSLAAQLEALEGLRQAGRENNAPLAESADAVQLLTVHASKGLEFPVVFLVSMHKGTGGKQARAPIALHREGERYSLGATWRMSGEDGTLPDREMRASEDARKQREAEEEDRLLYVAMTRAEERLVLVWSEKKSPDRRWLTPVNEGLNLNWEIGVGEAVLQDGIRVFRAVGAPPLRAVPGSAPEARQTPSSVVLLDALPVTLPEPASVPATQLARFAACPRRYFLRTLVNWPAPAGTPLAPFDDEPPGERAGEGMDDDSPAPGPGGMQFGDAVHHVLAGADRSMAPPEALALVDRFRASETGWRAERATRIGHETPILFEFDGLLIRGAIDLWFEEGGELILVDYKTDQYIGAERLHEYSTQLRFYAVALSRALNRKVSRAILAALRSGREIEIPLTAEADEALRGVVDAFREAHRAGEFPLAPGPQCQWCQYAGGACPQPRPEPSPES
jgi:ATP-dependent exoDNAse (exonuclease V) beta subunit